MTRTIVYSAAAQLRHPRRFLREAARDLALSAAIAQRLFAANLKARHRRAFLGYLWLVLPTLLVTATWVFLQSQRLIDFGPVRMPYAVYVATGMLLWQLFLDGLNAPLSQLGAAKAMVTRSRVPLEAVVAAGVLEAGLNFVIRLAVILPVLMLFGSLGGWTLLLFPLGALLLALLGLALGLVLTPLGLLYEDVGRAIAFATGVWFFLTPVVYPLPASGLILLNPVTPLLDLSRHWLTTGAPAEVSGMTVIAIEAIIVLPLLLAGLLLLRLSRPHLVARLG